MQTLLYTSGTAFRPKCAKQVDGVAVTVENVDDQEYMQLKKEYGNDVGTEIQRAYTEMQEYGNMVVGRNAIPWDSKKKRPLEVDQLIIMVASGFFRSDDDFEEDAFAKALETEIETGTQENASLHKRMKYTIDNMDELQEGHSTGGTEVRGC